MTAYQAYKQQNRSDTTNRFTHIILLSTTRAKRHKSYNTEMQTKSVKQVNNAYNVYIYRIISHYVNYRNSYKCIIVGISTLYISIVYAYHSTYKM